MSTNAHQIDIDSMEGVAHVIRSGKEAASIFVDIENGFRKGEPGKLEFNIIHLKIVGTLGCYEGSINAEKHEDWRQILADMPADRFLEAFASDRSEAPIDIEATLKAAEAFIEEKHASKVIDRTEGKEAMEFLMVARGMSTPGKLKGGAESFVEGTFSEIAETFPALAGIEGCITRSSEQERAFMETLWQPFCDTMKDECAPAPAPAYM